MHHEYASQGQPITKEFYRDVLRRLHDAVRCKRPVLWSTGNWRLHQDNDPVHSSHLSQTFFGRKTRLLWFARILTLLIWLPVPARRSDTFLTDLVLLRFARFLTLLIWLPVPARRSDTFLTDLVLLRFARLLTLLIWLPVPARRSDTFLTDLVLHV